MNAKFFKHSLIAALFFVISTNIKAQMSSTTYSIINNRKCDVAIHYEVSDCSNNVICNSTYQIISGNGGVFSIPAGCPNPGYDIFVWLKEIDYVDVTGGNNNGSVSSSCLWSGQGLNATGTNAPGSCPSTNWSMSWNSTFVLIN